MKNIIIFVSIMFTSFTVSAERYTLVNPLQIMNSKYPDTIKCVYIKANPGNGLLYMFDRYNCFTDDMPQSETAVLRSDSGRVVTEHLKHRRVLECKQGTCTFYDDGSYGGVDSVSERSLVTIPSYYYFMDGSAYRYGTGPQAEIFYGWATLNPNNAGSANNIEGCVDGWYNAWEQWQSKYGHSHSLTNFSGWERNCESGKVAPSMIDKNSFYEES